MAAPPPLKGIKVLEFAGLAPGPYAGMLMADAGASVLRVDRRTTTTASPTQPTSDVLARHKFSIAVDLKSAAGVALLKRLIRDQGVDVLIDPFRPGVMEKLGLGPADLVPLNPRLIYARMTGFRRDGRYADMAGHDINYLAVSGALSLLGREGQPPHAPWNLLADFAGGGATLFQAVLLALVARVSSGKGQVVEANMVDGSAHLATFPRMMLKTPMGDRGRGRNVLDGGCPWYDTYETRDGKYMSVGALEPQFFTALIRGLSLDGQGWEQDRNDPSRWPELRRLFEQTFRRRTRAEWESVFDGTDACCLPVLDHEELEAGAGTSSRGGDQRPAMTLRDTPLMAVAPPPPPKQDSGGDGHGKGETAATAAARGQGQGVEGAGYDPAVLWPGEGGEETLRAWAGWQKGREYDVVDGGFVLTEKTGSKL